MKTSFMILKYILRTTYRRLQRNGVQMRCKRIKEMLNDIKHIMNDNGIEIVLRDVNGVKVSDADK